MLTCHWIHIIRVEYCIQICNLKLSSVFCGERGLSMWPSDLQFDGLLIELYPQHASNSNLTTFYYETCLISYKSGVSKV